MDLRNQEASKKIEMGIETIQSREGVERVSLIHQNGINIKSSPKSLDNKINEVALASSTIFSLTNKIHDHNWEYIILECRYGRIIIIPLFFDQSSEKCPFFLQIITKPDSNLKDLLLNATNSIEIIIKELMAINEELQFTSSKIPIEINEPLNFNGENSRVGAILSDYFGSTGSLDIENITVSINSESINSIGSNRIRSEKIDKIVLFQLRSLLSNSDKVVQILKNTELTSIRIDYSTNFHFLYPLLRRTSRFQEDFLSIITKNQSNLGYWNVIISQITRRINNLFI